MEFKTVEEAKKYLESLDSIIIPKEYTYFVNASTFCFPELDKLNAKKNWTILPTSSFKVKREMSFWTREDLTTDLLKGNLKAGQRISYGELPKSTKPFQIRVIFPNKFLTEEEVKRIDLTKQEYDEITFKNYQFGRGRHPKIFDGEIIEIFSTSLYDEITGVKEDIFYGIRNQDLIKYAEIVSEELQKNQNIPMGKNPATLEGINHEWKHQTFALQKNQNNCRFLKKYFVDGLKGQYSEFEVEYIQELRKNNIDLETVFGNSHDNTISNIEQLLGIKIMPTYEEFIYDQTYHAPRKFVIPKSNEELIKEQTSILRKLRQLCDAGKFNELTFNLMRDELAKEYRKMRMNLTNFAKAKSSVTPSSNLPDDDYDIGIGMTQEQTSSKKTKPYIKSTTIEVIQNRYNRSQKISSNTEKPITKNNIQQNYEQPQELSNNSQSKNRVLTDLYEQQQILEEFVRQHQELQEDLENEEDYGMSM